MMRTSPSGTELTQTAMMTNRLKAADPTMVEGPSLPSKKLSFIICMYVCIYIYIYMYIHTYVCVFVYCC